jgi:hypothetical protein
MRSKTKAPETVDTIPVIEVTPEMAQQWLDTRFDNERTLREGTRVAAMVRDMQADRWYFTGDPIRFDSQTGRLIDGQHRLTAVVQSGLPQPFAIINLPMEAHSVIDTGSARTLGDLLLFGGHVKGRTLGAIIRRALTYLNGRGTEGGDYYPTITESTEFLSKNQDALIRAVEVAQKSYQGGRRLPVSPAILGATYFLCAEKDQDLADGFFDKLIFGLDLHEGEPVLALRDRMLRTREQQGRPMTPDDAFRFIIVAWNLTREGASVKRLLTPRGGWRRNNTPTIT